MRHQPAWAESIKVANNDIYQRLGKEVMPDAKPVCMPIYRSICLS
jgi:hypothetical protein